MKDLNDNAKNATKTIFCDIDGTLVKFPDGTEGFKDLPKGHDALEVLPGTLDKLWEWETHGYRIILTTGRKESMRKVTEKLLTDAGIFWDHLVMGLGPGKRYLINDINNGNNTAYAVNVERNHGIGSVDLNRPEYNSTSLSSCTLNYEDVCCPPPEKRYESNSAEAKAIQIAQQRHVEAVNDISDYM